MNIQWYGLSCFKIVTKETTILTDPFGKESGLRSPRMHTDIITISHEHPNHNNRASFEESFVIDTPGEFEKNNIFIKGISSFHDKEKGAKKGANTIYTFSAEDIKLCHLGDLGIALDDKQIERLGDIDILMIPVGEIDTLPLIDIIKTINQIEPKVIIPMHYDVPNLKVKLSKLDKFLKEFGASKKKSQDKWSFRKKDVDSFENEVIILNHQG